MTFAKSNKTKIATKNDIVMTNSNTAIEIIEYFKPQFKINDKFLDPCKGDGAFFDNMPKFKEYCEISQGKDFFDFYDNIDWIITNPPFSIYDDFLIHSFEISNNVIFFCPLNKAFKSKKIDTKIIEYGGLKEIIHMGTGGKHGFPFGFPVGCLHYQKDYAGDIKLTRKY